MSPPTYAFGPFSLDVDRAVLTRRSVPLNVSARGVALLSELVRADGKAVSRATLMDAAWPNIAVEDGNLSVQIAMLRKLLGPTADGTAWITTVPRVGYRFAGKLKTQTAEPPSSEHSARTTIVVVPFENLDGDPESDYLADGISDDIIAALVRFRWFSVASRGTSFSYRKAGRDPRTIGRELDAASSLKEV